MNIELINHLMAASEGLPAPLKREVNAVIHKITYPMADILAQVPGASLTDRAKKLRVSRQTMYVWASERFRPTKVQAKRIARVTGVPIEQIIDNGFETAKRTRRKAGKKAATVAKGRKGKTRTDRVASPKRRRARKTGNELDAA